MNKEKWQEELNELQLSDQQKIRILNAVRKPRGKKVDWMYRLALPSFIVLSLFFVILIIGKNSEIRTHQAAIPLVEIDHTRYLQDMLFHYFLLVCLVLICGILFYQVMLKTVRWEQGGLFVIKQWIVRNRFLYFVLLGFVIIISFGLGLNFVVPLMVVNTVIFLCILSLHFFVLLYLACDMPKKKHCPHCHIELSAKEIGKMGRTINSELRCSSCQKPVYFSKRTKQLNGYLSIPIPLIFFAANWNGLPLYLFLPITTIYILFILVKIYPLYIELTDEEQFLY